MKSKAPAPEAPSFSEVERPEIAPEAAHLAQLVVPDIDEAGAVDPLAPHDADDVPEPEPEQISKESFFEVWQISFAAPGMVHPAFKPLAVQPEEGDSARAASDAVHRLLQIYYPAALMPGSETIALLMQAGPFLIAKVMVARSIMVALRTPPPREVNRAEGAERPRQEQNRSAPRGPLDWMDAEEVMQ